MCQTVRHQKETTIYVFVSRGGLDLVKGIEIVADVVTVCVGMVTTLTVVLPRIGVPRTCLRLLVRVHGTQTQLGLSVGGSERGGVHPPHMEVPTGSGGWDVTRIVSPNLFTASPTVGGN